MGWRFTVDIIYSSLKQKMLDKICANTLLAGIFRYRKFLKVFLLSIQKGGRWSKNKITNNVSIYPYYDCNKRFSIK